MSKGHAQKTLFSRFIKIFLSYFPLLFGVLGRFTRPMTLGTCLKGMTKNKLFLSFMVVFASCCPQLVVLVQFTNPMIVGTRLKGMTKN
jgi:hypothetical protein